LLRRGLPRPVELPEQVVEPVGPERAGILERIGEGEDEEQDDPGKSPSNPSSLRLLRRGV
jgi:hypothetical protein